MLSKPEDGWSEFWLEGTYVADLSYLDDIPFTWLERAIYGLETMLPFTVKGTMEPTRILCTVSYWNCHIVYEVEDNKTSSRFENGEKVENEFHEITMLQFCQYLYDDISRDMHEWVNWHVHELNEEEAEERKKALKEKLMRLKQLISEREKCFGERWSEYFT